MKKYIKIIDVMKNLKVAERTVYKWMEVDGLPFTKIGGALRFDEKEVQAWVDEQNEKNRQKKRA